MEANPSDMSVIAEQAQVMAEELKRCRQWPSHRPSAEASKAADDVLHMVSTYGSASARTSVDVLHAELAGDGSHCSRCGKFIPSGENRNCHAEDCEWAVEH